MAVKFNEKFEEILKEEASEFGIDWSLVEIEYVRYEPLLMTSLPVSLDDYVVRMRVLEFEGEIPNIDEWFRSHKFIYAIMSKHVENGFKDIDMMTFDVGTIGSIATKIRDGFRNFRGQ